MAHLNAFQLKGLRRILKMKTAFVDRANTNQKVFEKANAIRNPKSLPNKNIQTFTEYIEKQQQKLLTHTIRADEQDPLRQCMLEKGTFTTYDIPVRRVGRPRENWVNHAYKPMCMKNTGVTEKEYKSRPVIYQRKIQPFIANREL